MVPTQQPAYGDLSVQTEWGQGVTQLLQWDSERREVLVKPWVTLPHMALLAHPTSVSRARTSNWRDTGLSHGQVEAPQRGIGKHQQEFSAIGPRPGEMVVPNRPYGGMYAGSSAVQTQDMLQHLFQVQKAGLSLFYLPR